MSNTKEDWEPHINVVGNDVWYTGHITVIGVNDLIKELLTLINSKHVNSKIQLFISTEGGDVTSGMTLYHFLCSHAGVIKIISVGKLYSIGALLLFTPCDTYVYPNICVLFHPMKFTLDDEQGAMFNKIKMYKHLIKAVDNIYKTKNFKCKWKTQDVYMFADDLIKKNIVIDVWWC